MIDSQHETTEHAQANGSKRRKRALQIGIAAVAILGVGIGIGAAVSGASTTAAAKPATASILMTGSLYLPFVGGAGSPQALDTTSSSTLNDGDTCRAVGGFADVAAGTAVTLGGPNGQTLAVTALSAGSVIQPASSASPVCEFDFSADVTGDLSDYTVTITGRGTQVFTPAQVVQNSVILTLGD